MLNIWIRKRERLFCPGTIPIKVFVLVRFPLTVIKYLNKSNIREKRLIWLTVPGYSSLLQGSL